MKKEMIGKILLNYTKIKILNLTLMSFGEAGVRSFGGSEFTREIIIIEVGLTFHQFPPKKYYLLILIRS